MLTIIFTLSALFKPFGMNKINGGGGGETISACILDRFALCYFFFPHTSVFVKAGIENDIHALLLCCRIRSLFLCILMSNIGGSLSSAVFTCIETLTLSQTSPGFYCVCGTSLLKTLWEKEKLLVTSNFSFSRSVFYLLGELSTISVKFEIVIYKLLQFRRV